MANEVRAFTCPRCGEPSKSSVFGVTTAYNDAWEIPAEFALLQCSNSNCQGPLVQMREDYGQGFEQDKPVFLFPQPRRLSIAVPRKLRHAFEEAQKCHDAKAYTATLVMVRRVLEGTCQDQGSSKRVLAEAIKELEGNGKIDSRLAEWAHLLRVVGNEGAHFTGSDATRADAEDSLDFAEALLDHIYVLRQRFEDFKQRQDERVAKRKAKKKP